MNTLQPNSIIKYHISITKSLGYVGIGILILIASLFVPIFRIVLIILGLMVFFTGIISIFKRKAQLVLNKDSIYIGFKDKRKIPWGVIDNIDVIQKKVDGIKMWHLVVRVKITKNGLTSYLHHEANLDLIKVNPNHLLDQIDFFKNLPN